MTNEKDTPERIYLHPTSAEANINPWPLEPSEYVEYVRANLLTTARQEAREAAFKEAHKAIDNMDIVITRFQPRAADTNGWYSAIKQAHKAITALEAAMDTKERG